MASDLPRLAQLLGGSAQQRGAAYAELRRLSEADTRHGDSQTTSPRGATAAEPSGAEPTRPSGAGLVKACVAPLLAVLCKDAAEVGPEEFEAAALALLSLMPLSCADVQVEFLREGQPNFFSILSAPGSAAGQVKAKDPRDITAKDARTVICYAAIIMANHSHGFVSAAAAPLFASSCRLLSGASKKLHRIRASRLSAWRQRTSWSASCQTTCS